jgi:hypothetical protein
MDIKLNDEQFAQVIGKQILESITPEARDKLVTDAIVALNKTERGYSGRTEPSALQQAFNNAVGVAVQKLAHELVEQSPIRDAIEQAAREYIAIFPEAWDQAALQRDVMAAIVQFARDHASRD